MVAFTYEYDPRNLRIAKLMPGGEKGISAYISLAVGGDNSF